ncbi:hypothetical protein [Weissella viridescens]|uniref:hypothetical protein n=1 Tax=Weissella viridescens TaxID=1629 RepID=UPI003AF315E2
MWYKKHRKLVISISIIFFIGVFFALRPANDTSSNKDSNRNKLIQPMLLEDITESGVVRSRHSQSISVPSDSKIHLFVDNGSVVSSGDVIGTTTDEDAVFQISNEMNGLETEIANSQALGHSTISLQEQYSNLQIKLNKATKNIIAPYDGILTIDDTNTDNVKLSIDSVIKYIDSTVSDYDYNNLSVGDEVNSATNTGQLMTNEKITYISAISKNSGKIASYEFKTTAGSNYRNGQQVTLKIKQHKVVLPKSAVQTVGNKQFVYVIQKGRASKQLVHATVSGANYVISTDELNTDVKIIKNPGNHDLDGHKI